VTDEAGYLRIVGRRKDIIIRGGENISPAEVENLLFGHPMIRAVSIVGYPDQRLGQRACAFIVPQPSSRPTVRDLVAFLETLRVAKFKYPERVELVDSLPMTASGKVRKEALRELLRTREPAD
jgi:acyl-CoA synthetase (AMP-forming)/AMP-acid ligase II